MTQSPRIHRADQDYPSQSNQAELVDIEQAARGAALERYVSQAEIRFTKRLPGMDYRADKWDFKKPSGQHDKKGKPIDLHTLHNIKTLYARPLLVENDLADLHPSFKEAARALLALHVLEGGSKAPREFEDGLRHLRHLALPASGWRADAPIWNLRAEHLRFIERAVISRCLSHQTAAALSVQGLTLEGLIEPGVTQMDSSGSMALACLTDTFTAMYSLYQAKVLGVVPERMMQETHQVLLRIKELQRGRFRAAKGNELGPSIQALSDAICAMANDDARLSETQQAALCVMGIEMCAPSRVNEVLTLSIHDRLHDATAYDQEPQAQDGADAEAGPAPAGESDKKGSKNKGITEAKLLHGTHAQMKAASLPTQDNALPNTVLMKGSKGAAWGAKPLMDFMVVMFNECFDRLLEMGKRSRMLLAHYEQHPDQLYLPHDLEHLRGHPLTRVQVGRIMLLDGSLGSNKDEFLHLRDKASKAAQKKVWPKLSKTHAYSLTQKPEWAAAVINDRQLFMETTGCILPDTFQTINQTLYIEWSLIEAELLGRVMANMRSLPWVTPLIRYSGRLSHMLMAFDHKDVPPYLPGALSAEEVRMRLKSCRKKELKPTQTAFEALGIKMPMRGEGSGEVKLVPAYCSPHDPRRWLTTMSLRHGGAQLSRMVVNMWANRADIGQLNAYDYRSMEERAQNTLQAVPAELQSMESARSSDLDEMLQEEMIGSYGLGKQSGYAVVAGLRKLRMATMDAIHNSEISHPTAKAGDQLLVLYPTRFGVCLHQHHATPCTNGRGCEGACSTQRIVKGHLPSNERVHQREQQLFEVICHVARRLILARNREVVHDLVGPAKFIRPPRLQIDGQPGWAFRRAA